MRTYANCCVTLFIIKSNSKQSKNKIAFEIYMVGYSSVIGRSCYIHYCDFVSYLLVISNFLEQKVILFLEKSSYKRLTCFKINYCIML